MRARGKRTIWLAAGVTVALMVGGLAPASAKERLDSFAGSCSVQGTVAFSPPATNTLQPLTTVYDATGTCSGTLNGGQVSNAPVTMHNVGDANGSCPYAQTTEPGQGSVTFADGTTIRYRFEFTSVLTEIYFPMQGERSGSATGHGSFLTQRTPPDVALQCGGEGAAEVPMDLSFSTDSPLVSKRRGGR
jgi:hypothetical protein